MQAPVLSVTDLCITAVSERGVPTPIVKHVSFSIQPGKVLALIGESGSGKTTISLSAMGYFKPGCELASGSIMLEGTELTQLDARQLQELRGTRVSYVAQSAAAAFNGAHKVNRQVTEVPVTRMGMSSNEAGARAVDLYGKLELPDPQNIGRRYPHQVSGGQLQRLMAAMAMITEPRLLILDEPTTALDVTTQIEVLRAFKALIAEKGVSVIYVTHDLALVAQIADDIIVLKDGEVVEQGPVEQIIHKPKADYTLKLIGAAHVMPDRIQERPAVEPDSTPPVLELSSVSAGYGKTPATLAVRDVSLAVRAGEVLGIIGESGSGKTSLGRVISGLMDIRVGEVRLEGSALRQGIANRSRDHLRAIQFAYQMADVALNPRHTIRKTLARPLRFYFGLEGKALDREVEHLLYLVELPTTMLDRFPSELSGGQKQRVNLARALAAKPKLIICDEITSALDTIVAKAILELIEWLRRELQIAFIFITHDISTVAKIADRVGVMRHGELVEYGDTGNIFSSPGHQYTQLLLNSVPEMRTDWLDEIINKRTDARIEHTQAR